jgi:molybdate transport system regulatory protein
MVTVRFRLDVSPACSIGPGKIALLQGIERTGSLRRTARELGMSYRRAWLLVDGLNRSFTAPVTSASVGGKGGGGVTLTALGVDLMRRYAALARRFEALARREFGKVAADTARHAPHVRSVPHRRLTRRTGRAAG